VIAALAGIGEELFFRGMIQLGLSGVLGLEVWHAILIASLIFGLAHAVTLTYFILAFVISVYLGFIFDFTDNLLVPIAIHAFYDFFVFLYIRYTPHNLREAKCNGIDKN
jgi:membrane protease YdiL (CAAX protease family)